MKDVSSDPDRVSTKSAHILVSLHTRSGLRICVKCAYAYVLRQAVSTHYERKDTCTFFHLVELHACFKV